MRVESMPMRVRTRVRAQWVVASRAGGGQERAPGAMHTCRLRPTASQDGLRPPTWT